MSDEIEAQKLVVNELRVLRCERDALLLQINRPKQEEPTRPFVEELEALIDRYSIDSASDTPAHVLAEYLVGCLDAYEKAITERL